jgi:trehalose-phosphatase
MRGFQGAQVEDKGLSWTAHFRGVASAMRPRALRTFWRTVRAAAESGRVWVRRGAMIREVLPPVAWDKGAAVRWILARSAPQPVILYIGDDAGDEPAFAALGTRGASVIVGRRKQTRARFFVRHPGEVQRLLCLLARLHDGSAPSSPHTDTT